MKKIIWALFGNDLDGVDADSPQAIGWRPDLPVGSWKRRVLWWLRNPFHNLLWHVLGVVDPQTQLRKTGWIRLSKTGNPESNWGFNGDLHFCWIRHWDWHWGGLPFVSYVGKGWEGYIGWRERGNFGAALRRSR